MAHNRHTPSTSVNQPNEIQRRARTGPAIGHLIDHPISPYAQQVEMQRRPAVLHVTRGANGALSAINANGNVPRIRGSNDTSFRGGWLPDPWVPTAKWCIPVDWCMYQRGWQDSCTPEALERYRLPGQRNVTRYREN